MVKVFSFSLFGTDPKYFNGALALVEQAALMFPGYECWFYIHKDVLQDFIKKLEEHSNVRIFLRYDNLETSRPLMWRFEAIDHPDCDIMMPRDTDTRFYLREKFAIQEWLESGKMFHIMRDCPHHNDKVMAGMFGVRKTDFSWAEAMCGWPQIGWNYDQKFLGNVIYPKMINNMMVHDSFFSFEEDSKPFPINYDPDFHFVGEYVFEDGSRDKRSIEMMRQVWKKGTGPAGVF